MPKALLVLEDGTTFRGTGFGYPAEVEGEVIFSTGMVGYPESLTDPSYCEQILVDTYPLIGNYGVPSVSTVDDFRIPVNIESDRIQVSGFIVSRLERLPSHWASKMTLDEWMTDQKIPGMEGVDTRELTKLLRTRGTMFGLLKVGDDLGSDFSEVQERIARVSSRRGMGLVGRVTVPSPVVYGSGRSPVIVLVDCGVKYSIIRALLAKGAEVVRVPYDLGPEEILGYGPSGLVLSNGPGDPKWCRKTIETTRALIDEGLPIMGICLGSQILALAAGADTYKMNFGHRGQNQPCIDMRTGRCYITSQNHGYAIERATLKGSDYEPWFSNANDGTVEGIRHKHRPVFGVQFHPEATPGPSDTAFLFDEFMEAVRRWQN